MNYRLLLVGALLLGLGTIGSQGADVSKEKAALQAIGEYVGKWKVEGESKVDSKTWKEEIDWGWKIKGDNVAMAFKVTGGKQFSEGEIKYLADKKKYELTIVDADKKSQVFLGEVKAKRLTFVRVDETSKDKHTIEFSTNNEGARMVYNVSVQKKSAGLDKKVATASASKEGAALAGAKKPECIVTGGAATMTVSYMGKTYYVCCTGCRDEFNANAKKYVEEYEKSKK